MIFYICFMKSFGLLVLDLTLSKLRKEYAKRKLHREAGLLLEESDHSTNSAEDTPEELILHLIEVEQLQ